VVPPLLLGGEKVAVFMVDAFRFEMASELFEELKAVSGGAAIDLKPRLAELPTITAVGMNALAPVARGERLTVAGEFKGFRTGEYTVSSPDGRCRAMGASAAGGTCLRLELTELCERTPQALRAIRDHQLIVVDTTEIDDAGEANVGLHTFEATLRQLRAGWHHLQAAGVKQAVFTADHGFLLQDGTGAIPFGRKTDPSRRYVLDEHGRVMDGITPVSLASLGYDGLSGYLLLREDTAPFATPRPERFVHGGNSPQERIIPVLTITRKQAAMSGLTEYAVEAQALDGLLTYQRLRLRIVFPPGSQTSLAYAGPRTIDLDLRVPDRQNVQVIIKEVTGGASIKAGRLQVPVGEAWSEVLFTLEALADERVPIEVCHSDNIQKVRPARLDRLFFANGRQKPAPPPQRGAGPPPWAEGLEDERVRAVFVHIDRHGSIAETELIAKLGSAGAARRFALNFDAYLAKIPFEVRSESNASGKRYVREEDK
jgi:hypothetical protein